MIETCLNRNADKLNIPFFHVKDNRILLFVAIHLSEKGEAEKECAQALSLSRNHENHRFS
ncbi:MAG: hypothetical protein IJG45_09095 [Oscillospiraceae bacterium]|nr:hypothetical protein [Oscillospiraceae bacterium]